MAKGTKEKVVELTPREKLLASSGNLSEVISNLLGARVYCYVREKEDRNQTKHIVIEGSPLESNQLGIGKFLFKTFSVDSFGYIFEGDEERNPSFTLHCSYDHHTGGSNGHDLGLGNQSIELTFNQKEASWFVKL